MIGALRRLAARPRVRRADEGHTPPPLSEAAPADVTRLLRLEDEAGAALALSRTRLAVIGACVGVGFCIVALRAGELAVSGGARTGPGPSYASAPAPRGALYDVDGEILATNLDFHSLYADPGEVSDPERTARAIATVLTDLDIARTARLLSNKKRDFVWLARQLTPKQRQAIHMLGLGGIGFRVEPGRVYPKSRAAAHVVGYTDTDLKGVAGAELAFDTELRAGDNRPVRLSIDLTAQSAVERILRLRMAEYRAEGASAVLMRVGTGEIVSLVSLPDFDPNRVADSQDLDRFNRALTGTYELGSVMKPLTLAAGLETRTVALGDVFDATHPLKVPGFTIRDFHGEKRPLTAEEAVVHSSNIATAKMADQIGRETLRGFFSDLRLFERAPVELAESARERATVDLVDQAGLAPDPRRFVQQLQLNGRLTPSLVLRALFRGHMSFFEHAVAELAGIDHAKAWQLIHDAGPLGLDAVFQRTGLPHRILPAIKAALSAYHSLEVGPGGPQDMMRFRKTLTERIFTQFQGAPEADLNYCLERLEGLDGVTCPKPEGAFYLFPDVSAYFGRTAPGGRRIAGSEDLCFYLLEEHDVALVEDAAQAHGAAVGHVAELGEGLAGATRALEEDVTPRRQCLVDAGHPADGRPMERAAGRRLGPGDPEPAEQKKTGRSDSVSAGSSAQAVERSSRPRP